MSLVELSPGLLANSVPNQFAFRLGQGIGTLLLLAVYGALLLLVFQACTQGTKGWLIVGCLSGLVLLGLSSVVALGIFRGLQRRAAYRSFPSPSLFTNPQTVRGRRLAYHITLPMGFVPEWGNPHFDVTSSRDGFYISVVAAKSVGTSIEIAEQARQKLQAEAAHPTLSDLQSVQIDGRTWLQFTAHWQDSASLKEPHFSFYVYSGPEGMFQIVGSRSGSSHPQDNGFLQAAALSFRFPGDKQDPVYPSARPPRPKPLFGNLVKIVP